MALYHRNNTRSSSYSLPSPSSSSNRYMIYYDLVPFEDLNKQNRSLLLIPHCNCQFCISLLYKGSFLYNQFHVDDVARLLFNMLLKVIVYRFENHTSIIENLTNKKDLRTADITKAFFSFNDHYTQMLDYRSQFVNDVFASGLLTQEFDEAVFESITEYKNIVKGYVERVNHDQQEEISRENNEYQYILTQVRPFHNLRISFFNVMCIEDLPTVHDQYAFLTSPLASTIKKAKKMKIVQSGIKAYIDPELYDNRNALISSRVSNLLRNRCTVCLRFDHNQYACFKKHCINICKFENCEECDKIKAAKFKCSLNHCKQCRMHIAAMGKCPRCKF